MSTGDSDNSVAADNEVGGDGPTSGNGRRSDGDGLDQRERAAK